MLLSTISPRAAKLYLALSTLAPPTENPPIARFHLAPLANCLNLSPRTCIYALRELQDLHLITRLPKRSRRAPSTCRIEPLPYTQPAACLSPNLQPAAPITTPNTQPVAPLHTPNTQPVASHATATPISTPKTHNVQPAAPIKPNRGTPDIRHPSLNPALQSLLATLAKLTTPAPEATP